MLRWFAIILQLTPFREHILGNVLNGQGKAGLRALVLQSLKFCMNFLFLFVLSRESYELGKGEFPLDPEKQVLKTIFNHS